MIFDAMTYPTPTTDLIRDPRRPCVSVGTQWVVDAAGCNASALQSLEMIQTICDDVVESLRLTVIGEPAAHRFASPHGVTLLYLLSESHLACHTYPEHGLATFNFVCCREEADWPWADKLRCILGATDVMIRVMHRGAWSTSPGSMDS